MMYALLNIKETNSSTILVLSTFSKTILPALLPFIILNQLLIKTGVIDFLSFFFQYISYPLFKISGKGASVILIGILNGFPSSTIFSSLLVQNNQLEKDEAQRIVNSIFFPSISFLFVIVNSLLNNNHLFTILIISLYLTGFLNLYLSSFKIKKEPNYISFTETKNNIKEKLKKFNLIHDLKETINYAFNTLINILGIIVIFAIPCNIINSIIQNNTSLFLQGLLEFSMPSIKLINNIKYPELIVISLSILLPFSGLSSILQASLFLTDASLNTKSFITNRIIITIYSFISTMILLFFL